jgi:hypothetical protein
MNFLKSTGFKYERLEKEIVLTKDHKRLIGELQEW